MRLVVLGDRDPEQVTHRAADAAIARFPADLGAHWVATDDPGAKDLSDADGVWLMSGSPYRDDATAYAAIRHCLATTTPFLGTCAGFQYACVTLARSRLGLAHAAHAETDPQAADPVIAPLACSLYGEWRTVQPEAGTRLAAICGTTPFEGFHFCGFGLAEAYVPALVAAGIVIGARSADAGVEAVEVPEHPFFVATAFQPQVQSADDTQLHPLLRAFLAAVRARATREHPGGKGRSVG